MRTLHNLKLVALALASALAVTGCADDSRAGTELAAKSEYSIIQGFEYDYRQRAHAQPYIVVENALGSEFDVLGLPRKDRERGYVWLIANPRGEPLIKQMPSNTEFVVNKGTLAAIEASTGLSPVVKAHLSGRLSQEPR